MTVLPMASVPSARLIDGKAHAKAIREELAAEIAEINTKYPLFSPHLVIVQVGERQDSNVYVRMKEQAAKEVGMRFSHAKLNENVSEGEVFFLLNLNSP